VYWKPPAAHFKITDRGRQILESPPARLDAAFLRQHFEEFRAFTGAKAPAEGLEAPPAEPMAADAVTPEESLENAYQTLRRAVESDILARLLTGF
jgi:restriction system protein